jgi:hypothetical protein
MKKYANAKEVLPEELFLEVKKHYTGMMYVAKGNDSEDRKKLVIALWKQKTPAREISLLSGLSVRRVHQIIAQECRENAFLGCRKQ